MTIIFIIILQSGTQVVYKRCLCNDMQINSVECQTCAPTFSSSDTPTCCGPIFDRDGLSGSTGFTILTVRSVLRVIHLTSARSYEFTRAKCYWKSCPGKKKSAYWIRMDAVNKWLYSQQQSIPMFEMFDIKVRSAYVGFPSVYQSRGSEDHLSKSHNQIEINVIGPAAAH